VVVDRPTKKRKLDAVRAARKSRERAELALWKHARVARNAGATLAEIADAAGVAIETARRRLGEASG
jgi:hypothetical protein